MSTNFLHTYMYADPTCIGGYYSTIYSCFPCIKSAPTYHNIVSTVWCYDDVPIKKSKYCI